MKFFKCLALLLGLAAPVAEAQVGETAGIGAALAVDGTNIVVKNILADSPAALAHNTLRIGDRIIAVAQDTEPAVPVRSGDLARAVAMIRGVKGTTVRLTIFSAGEDDAHARVVSFVRGELKALASWGDGLPLTNGMKAPDIEMVALPGRAAERLSDYTGKIVVLEFWATWCGPCQTAMADFQTLASRHPEWNGSVVLIAASVDDNPDAAEKHLKMKGWDQTHNVWAPVDAIKAFHINGIPTTYVIDREGKIVGADPRDLPGILNHEVHPGPVTEP